MRKNNNIFLKGCVVYKNMETNTKLRKDVFIIGCIFLLSIFARISNFHDRFITIGIVNFISVIYLLKINPFKKIGIALVFLYFLITLPAVVYSTCIGELVPGVIVYTIYITSSVFAIIIHRKGKMVLFSSIYAILFVFLTLNHENMMNYYMYEESKMIGQPIPKIELFDAQGNKFQIQKNGKIQVIDLWSNACGYCIDAFPKFEKLKNDYKNDKEVVFYAINVKLRREDGVERAREYLKKYSFNNYFTDESICEKLDFQSVPKYMIIDKDGTIKYFGSLNSDNFETFNNIYDLINDEKK